MQQRKGLSDDQRLATALILTFSPVKGLAGSQFGQTIADGWRRWSHWVLGVGCRGVLQLP